MSACYRFASCAPPSSSSLIAAFGCTPHASPPGRSRRCAPSPTPCAPAAPTTPTRSCRPTISKTPRPRRLRAQPRPRRAARRRQLQEGRVELRAEVELTDGERLAAGAGARRLALRARPARRLSAARARRGAALVRARGRAQALGRGAALHPAALSARTITADALSERWEGAGAGRAGGAARASCSAHLDEPMELAGDEARLPVGERKQVKLVREEGVWRVETLE